MRNGGDSMIKTAFYDTKEYDKEAMQVLNILSSCFAKLLLWKKMKSSLQILRKAIRTM